jgi:hypothetical protein
VYRTASPSEKISPLSATYKSWSSPLILAAASGTTPTISVYVRKNSSYNGNAPRLVLRANRQAGVTSDTVLATFSASADTWQLLSYTFSALTAATALEVYVDCDGTAGSIFVDDWSAVGYGGTVTDPMGVKHWSRGTAAIYPPVRTVSSAAVG